jgi:aldehyde dehydrogenase family 7 protein A1
MHKPKFNIIYSVHLYLYMFSVYYYLYLMDKELTFNKYSFLKDIGLSEDNLGCYTGKRWTGNGETKYAMNPTTGKCIARFKYTTEEEYEECIKNMEEARDKWFEFPMIKRGLIVQEIGERFKALKKQLGSLVTIEMGKILSEGEGEIQEAIDICDYAVGLSRTLNGKTLASERDNHTIIENWNPLGLIGVITAFNFPAAVCMWNTAISLVCGDLTVWKGSPTTSLVTIATTKIIVDVLEKWNFNGVFTMVSGDANIGEKITNDHRLKLISFTGSTAVGKRISTVVHSRFGRTILELGGNNAIVVMDDADLKMALASAVFGAVGTCGQRCTTLRRLILHEKIYDQFVKSLLEVYPTIKIGDPFESDTLCGPLHSDLSVKIYVEGLETIKKQGGKILYGGKKHDLGGNFVFPTIVEIDKDAEIIKHELFCPILYVIKCSSLEEAVKINNNVPQGLSSGVFSNSMQNCFKFIGPNGSDCGLVNVNTGTSGAEIGGAFGGEKETGGGRESGGEAWKQYMRQTTCTVNYGKVIRLAQGVKFPHF